jgi:hypothetical protein
VLVREHGKKRYQHFLYSVNHLNRRKSPSAPHVSQEIETDFRSSSSFFFQKSREVPEVADLSISCGVGVVVKVCESWGCSFCARVRVVALFAEYGDRRRKRD